MCNSGNYTCDSVVRSRAEQTGGKRKREEETVEEEGEEEEADRSSSIGSKSVCTSCPPSLSSYDKPGHYSVLCTLYMDHGFFK